MSERNQPLLEFAAIGQEALDIREQTLTALRQSGQLEVVALEKDLLAFATEDGQEGLLRVAVVGQYDGGKSTIVSALTGCRDLKISAGITTSEVSSYLWNGILLHDTPGIGAGQPDHDAKAYALIDRADLLIYVVTDEGFSPAIAQDFQDVAFTRKRSAELMLVVNKISQHAADQLDNVVQKVLAWCQPLTAADLRLTCIDAKDFLDAETEPDPEIAEALRRESQIATLRDRINQFVAERGLLGRWTAPLHALAAVLRQALAQLTTDDPAIRAALELLHQKRLILRRARLDAEKKLLGLVAQTGVRVRDLGDEVADAIEPEAGGRAQQLAREAEGKGEQYVHDLNAAIDDQMNDSVANVERELQQMAQGKLAKRVAEIVEQAETSLSTNQRVCLEQMRIGPDLQRVQQGIQLTQKAALILVEWAKGPAFAGVLTARAVKGSHLHSVVYSVTKFFGVKFKPWGAVNVATRIGQIGSAVFNVLGLLGPLVQVFVDHKEDEVAAQLRDARVRVRTDYAEIAASLQSQYRDRLREMLDDTFGVPLQKIDGEIDKARQRDKMVGICQERLQACLKRVEVLIERIQSSRTQSFPLPSTASSDS